LEIDHGKGIRKLLLVKEDTIISKGLRSRERRTENYGEKGERGKKSVKSKTSKEAEGSISLLN